MGEINTNSNSKSVIDSSLAALQLRLNKPLVLVGMMGVGKSTIGRRLAAKLDLPFIDSDEAIEEAAQLSIAEIFTRFGEPYFRAGEARVVARLIQEHKGIIALGGGAFVNDESRALALQKSIVVWIDGEVEMLVERTKKRGTRPILAQGNPAETLRRLYNERRSAYAEAHIHVTSTNGPHDETTNQILEALNKCT